MVARCNDWFRVHNNSILLSKPVTILRLGGLGSVKIIKNTLNRKRYGPQIKL